MLIEERGLVPISGCEAGGKMGHGHGLGVASVIGGQSGPNSETLAALWSLGVVATDA